MSAGLTPLLGGGRALVMQVAHPKVAAGVADHSRYGSQPWARLARTVEVMTKLAFGSPAESARQSERLDRMHRGVVGATADGQPYHAREPELLVWVWATLCDTALGVHDRLLDPLGPAERDRYYGESVVVAHACGVPEGACPPSWGEFQAYLASVIERDLRVTPAARRVLDDALAPPLPWPLGALAAPAQRLLTVGLLPTPVRELFGLGWDGASEARLRVLLGALSLAARATPGSLRSLPSVLALSARSPARAGQQRR